MMNPAIWLTYEVLNIYWYIILATVVISWLVSFNIINTTNPSVRQISHALYVLTEPILGPIRRILPDLGGLDFSPVVVLLIISFLQQSLLPYFFLQIAR
ncbi:MAG TPA: YggT family protein [Aestuariivirga sp.]